MSRDEGKIKLGEFHPDLKKDYNNIKTNALNAMNNIGTLSNLKTNAKNNTVEAINELFQYGVNLQTAAKSALDAAGISYTDTQLSTLINAMGQNLGGDGISYEELMRKNKNGENLKTANFSFSTTGTMKGENIIKNIETHFPSCNIIVFDGSEEISLREFRNNDRVDSFFDGFRIIVDCENTNIKIVTMALNYKSKLVLSYKNFYYETPESAYNNPFKVNNFDDYNAVLNSSLPTYGDGFKDFNHYGVRHNKFCLAYKGNNSSAFSTSYNIFYKDE